MLFPDPIAPIRHRLFTLLLAALLVTACAAKRQQYDVPEVPLPEGFHNAAQAAVTGSEAPPPKAPTMALESVLAQWWRLLDNPELDRLVDRALGNNTELRIAALQVLQAKARAEQARAEKWPVITAPVQAKGEGPRSGIGSVRPGGKITTEHTYQGSLRGDWRVDLWGESAALAESADLEVWRAAFQHDETRRRVVGEVVSSYVEYLSLNDRLRVAHETRQVLGEMLDAMRQRLEKGDATVTDVEQQKAAVHGVEATVPALELRREQVGNQLALLVGGVPGGLRLAEEGLDSLSLPEVLPGVPALLVLRRPDVRAVEAQLLGADADIDLARARVLPPLDLTAQVGYGSLYLSELFEPHTLFWNAIANLSVTLFDKGKRKQEVEYARAVHEEMVESYVRTLYGAVTEVEDALITIQLTGRRLAIQQQATRAAQRAWELSRISYQAGAIDYLALLDTERTYHRNLDESHQIRRDRYTGLVELFSALGGGVEEREPLPGEGQRPLPAPWERQGVVLAGQPQAPLVAGWQGATAVPGHSGERPWLVELSGLHDREGVDATWRDLLARFGERLGDYRLALIPDRPAPEAVAAPERGEWYRLFLAEFPTAQAADELCNWLQARQQRCRVVTSRLVDYYRSGLYWPERESVAPRYASRGEPHLEAALAVAGQGMPATGGEAATGEAAETPAGQTGFSVQVGSFTRRENADAALSEWQAKGYRPYLATIDGGERGVWYTVRLGAFEREAAAGVMAAELGRHEGVQAVTVPAELDRPGRAGRPLAADTVAATAEPAFERPGYAVQLGTFGERENAVAAARSWSGRGYDVYLCRVPRGDGGAWLTLRVGAFDEEGDAGRLAMEIATQEAVQAVVVPALLDGAGRPNTLDLRL